MKKILFFACTLLFIAACGGGDDAGDNNPTGGSEYLNVSNVDISGGNTTATLNIQASNNCEWVVSWSDSWIRVSPATGRGSQNVTITVSVNPSSSTERIAIVTIKNTSGTIVRNITVTQSANVESLQLSTTTMNFTYAASNQDVTVTSNTHWTITGGADWLHLNKTEGDNDGVVKISVDENTNESENTAVLTFKGSLGATQLLKVTQAGRSTDFTVSTKNITLDALAGTTSFSIAGDAHWTAQSSQDWATLSDISGDGNKTVIVSYAANTKEEQRSAEITVKSSSKTETITIIQTAATRPDLTDLQVTSISRTEATVAFRFTSMFPVTVYGVFYSTSENPTEKDPHISEEGSLPQGTFSVKITDLKPGTTYYLRAYAKSVVETGYSEDIVFTTLQGDQPNSGDNPQPGW
jgi:hypothetical protein